MRYFNLRKILASPLFPIILLFLFYFYLMYKLFIGYEQEEVLFERIATSKLIYCEKAIVRGGHGDFYNGYAVSLLDKKGITWKMEIKIDHYLALSCERETKTEKGE